MESLAYAALQNGPEFRGWRDAHPADRAAPDEDGPAVVITREEDRLQLALNRPGNRNAMTVEMRDALCEALQLAVSDASIATIEIRARGNASRPAAICANSGRHPLRRPRIWSAVSPCRAACWRSWLRAARRSWHGACIGSGIEFPAFAGRIVARDDACSSCPNSSTA